MTKSRYYGMGWDDIIDPMSDLRSAAQWLRGICADIAWHGHFQARPEQSLKWKSLADEGPCCYYVNPTTMRLTQATANDDKKKIIFERVQARMEQETRDMVRIKGYEDAIVLWSNKEGAQKMINELSALADRLENQAIHMQLVADHNDLLSISLAQAV